MRSCDQVNAFLSTFGSYTPNHPRRLAYEIKETDKVELFGLEWSVLHTAKGIIQFSRRPRSEVVAGDFVEIIQWPDYAVHWPRSQFIAQNIQPGDNVINRGNAELELQQRSDQLRVSGYVLKIKDRYFMEMNNGKVMTAWSIAGAKIFPLQNSAKVLQATIEILEYRNKKPQLLEVGFWSRTVETVQGGAA